MIGVTPPDSMTFVPPGFLAMRIHDRTPFPSPDDLATVSLACGGDIRRIVVIGADQRTLTHPLTVSERAALWRSVIPESAIEVVRTPDNGSSVAAWLSDHADGEAVVLQGHRGDARHSMVAKLLRPSATERDAGVAECRLFFPQACDVLLSVLADGSECEPLRRDQSVADSIAAAYGHGPFEAADVCLMAGDHILLIERGAEPEKGALAMPGGMLDPGEMPADAACREIIEEVDMDVDMIEAIQAAFAAGDVTATRYDDPWRDPRGVYNTTVHAIRIDARFAARPVTGKDDARNARWIDASDLEGLRFFADHGVMVRTTAMELAVANRTGRAARPGA
jgi:8-oxo-dGTP diphosphatase